jgi:hypothetical protein
VDLLQQRLHAVEPKLLPQILHELQFQLLAVQLAVEIKDMRFHVWNVSLSGVKVGLMPMLTAAGCLLLPNPGPASVDSIDRDDLIFRIIDVRGGDVDPAPAPIAMHDRSAHSIETAQVFGCVGDMLQALMR